MTGETGYIVPTNKIVLAGTVQSVEKTIENITGMYPGRLVMHGTTDTDVVVNDASGIAYGWLGYEQTPVMFRPASPMTQYVLSARAAVLHGAGMILVGEHAAGGAVVMGDKLMAAAAGELTKWTPIVAEGNTTEYQIVATAMMANSDAGGALIIRSEI